MEDFPANSAKSKMGADPPKEKVQQVTSNATIRRKRSGLGKQFKEVFFKGDARSSAEFVFFEVVVPSIKDTLFDAFESGIRALIYGDDAKKRSSAATSGYSGLGHVAYNRMATPTTASRPSEPKMLSRRARARHNFGEITITSREEANEVLDRMFDILSRYGSVSVATLYELTGVQSAMTDMKWGWTVLQGSKAVRTRQGDFRLDLPEPVELG